VEAYVLSVVRDYFRTTRKAALTLDSALADHGDFDTPDISFNKIKNSDKNFFGDAIKDVKNSNSVLSKFPTHSTVTAAIALYMPPGVSVSYGADHGEEPTEVAGAIAAVRNLKNPIRLAVQVLHHSDHVLLIGAGAVEFGQQFNIEVETDDYFFNQLRYDQWQKIKESGDFQLDHATQEKPYLGTVGAVALDQAGNLAAGTSTGGMTNKKFGRVGDSSLIGCGTYANNDTCAISCTGSGEYLIRAVTAHDVSSRMAYKGISLADACKEAIMDKLTEIGGDGGLIAIDKNGNICMPFNCEGMYRAARNQEFSTVEIYK